MSKEEEFLFYYRRVDKIDQLILAGEIAKFYKARITKEQEAIDCMVQHIKIFHKQAMNDEIASFGEPCSACKKLAECKADWFSKMQPLVERSSVIISVGHQEP